MTMKRQFVPFYGLIVLLLLFHRSTWSQIAFCTPEEAAVDGHFRCMEDCDGSVDDPLHILPGSNMRFCLSYFPNSMECPMQPFNREEILTCARQYGPNDQNHWVVFVGGSNNFFEFKTIIDTLLQTPFDSVYSPQEFWGGGEEVPLWAELGTLDMIWNANHEVIHKSVYGMGCNGDYYASPCNVADIFLNVPVPPQGGFRFSYINFHLAVDFPAMFGHVVGVTSGW
jgi:hypothetical protein